MPTIFDFIPAVSLLLKPNYSVFSATIFMSLGACLFGLLPEALGQFPPPNTTNSTVLSSNSSIQLIDFKTAAGQEFLSPILLVPIDAVDDNVYFAWSTNKTGNFEVFFTLSSDNGETIQNATNLSNSSDAASVDVSLKAEADNVYVSWWENYANASRIAVYVASNDNGRTFGDKVSLTNSIK
jgi:hypothetical protein